MLHELENISRIVLNCTTRCNFRCKHCFRDFPKIEKDLELDILKKVLEELKDTRMESVFITGGEPCLHERFDELVSLVARYRPFSLVTNGFYYEKFRYALTNHLQQLLYCVVSLDGADKATHDALRFKGSFEKVLASILYFKDFSVKVRIVSCLNKINFKQLKDIVVMVDRYKVDQLVVLSAIRTSDNAHLVLNDMEKMACVRELNLLNKEFNLDILIHPSLFTQNCFMLASPEPVINPYGELEFCYNITRNGSCIVGSLKENTFSKLYNNVVCISNNLQKIWTEYKDKGLLNFNCEFCNYFVRKNV